MKKITHKTDFTIQIQVDPKKLFWDRVKSEILWRIKVPKYFGTQKSNHK